ncbi:unnamed protein product, partial [Mesorhabditis belari]|uniref:Nucleoporin Nup54 alpha-helical domain-containing protein n=1 Tax=Mesorhabditis belari TaxID=2138241 RepID=A0AAF3FGW4_9BILA
MGALVGGTSKKEQLNHMPTSSVSFLEELPDVVFYAVMEKLPGRIIEKTVRQLSRGFYRRVELHRARLPRVYIDILKVHRNRFGYRRHGDRAMNDLHYTEANLIQHLEYLKERVTFKTIVLNDVNWDMFANCKFECEEFLCCVRKTALSPERFMDIFRSIRPTRKLDIYATGNNKIFPVTSDFFTNNYAIGLQEVRLEGDGNAMVYPLNDTILDSTPSIFCGDFQTSCGCTLNGIQTMLRDWYTSQRQINRFMLRVDGGEAQLQNFWHNLDGLLVNKRLLYKGSISSQLALERANGDVLELYVYIDQREDYLNIFMIRLVPGPEAGLYREFEMSFFSNTQTPPKPLFGSTAATSSTTNLFGSTAPAATQSVGLFGNTATPATATGGTLFGNASTTSNLFSKTGFGSPASTSLFPTNKPTLMTGGGLFGGPTAQQQPTVMRDTLQTILQNSDILVRSITSPQLFGDERDNIVALLNQVAAALGTGDGYHTGDQQPIKYTQDGHLYHFVAVAYNAASEYADSDGMVALVLRTPSTEFVTSAQKQNLEDAFFRFLGNKAEIKPHIESIKALPENCTEVTLYVTQKGKGRITSRELCQYLNQNEQKMQLEQQLKVDTTKIVSRMRMSLQQLNEYLKDVPPGLDTVIWEQYARHNPDPERLIPVPVRGFTALKQRHEAQIAEVNMQHKLVDIMSNRTKNNEAFLAQAWARLEATKAKQQELSFRLIRVLCARVSDARFSQPIDGTEEAVGNALETLLARLSAPEQIKEKLYASVEQIRELQEKQKAANNQVQRSGQKLSDADLLALKRYLARCQDGLENLVKVANNNVQDLNVLMKKNFCREYLRCYFRISFSTLLSS